MQDWVFRLGVLSSITAEWMGKPICPKPYFSNCEQMLQSLLKPFITSKLTLIFEFYNITKYHVNFVQLQTHLDFVP